MPEIIGPKADVTRIEDHVRRTLRAAIARGQEIASAATERLAPAVAAIDSALALKRSADEAEAVAWAAVLAEDAKSDTGIGAVRDAMWNALGRPRQSPYLDQVFPGGVATYTSGDPRGQPVLMHILQSRILAASASPWTDALRTGWSAEIEALRTTYAAAVDTHRPTEAAAAVGEAGYRAAVRMAHARLQAFKRDLLTLGLTQAQVHDIIPDASTGGSSTGTTPKSGTTDGGPSQTGATGAPAGGAGGAAPPAA
jgi:hypothetical protein